MNMGVKAFEEQWAIFLAAVCSQTYDQFDHKDGLFVVPLNYKVVATIQAKSLNYVWERFGFILESDQEIIIAFRGTSSTTNWISDAIATQIKFTYVQQECLTHKGFTDIYASARDEIMAVLARLSSAKKLYITGHSLGAALATLCAIDAAANSSFTAPHLFNYGSPRVGDPAFAKAFASYVSSSFRIANLFDIVTYAPPTVYKVPKKNTKYYYRHIETLQSLSFQNGSVGANHIIGSYFAELSKLQPVFAERLCLSNPGFCPQGEALPAENQEMLLF